MENQWDLLEERAPTTEVQIVFRKHHLNRSARYSKNCPHILRVRQMAVKVHCNSFENLGTHKLVSKAIRALRSNAEHFCQP